MWFEAAMLETKHNHHNQRMMEHLCNACEIAGIIVNCGTSWWAQSWSNSSALRRAYAPRSKWPKDVIPPKEMQSEVVHVHLNEIMCERYIACRARALRTTRTEGMSNRTTAAWC